MTKKILIIIGLLTLMLLPNTAFAEGEGGGGGTQKYTTIEGSYRPINMPFGLGAEFREGKYTPAQIFILVLQIIAGGLLYFAAPIAIIMIVIGASTLVMGSHENEKIDQAKKHLTWTIIGLLAIIFSYSIVRILIFAIIRATAG